MPGKEICMDVAKIKAIEDEIRDLINWVNVFEDEYGLESEVVQTLVERLEGLSKKIGNAQILK